MIIFVELFHTYYNLAFLLEIIYSTRYFLPFSEFFPTLFADFWSVPIWVVVHSQSNFLLVCSLSSLILQTQFIFLPSIVRVMLFLEVAGVDDDLLLSVGALLLTVGALLLIGVDALLLSGRLLVPTATGEVDFVVGALELLCVDIPDLPVCCKVVLSYI